MRPAQPQPDANSTLVVAALEQQGLHAALRLLNERTPHRFTGIFRYDGDMLRNVMLFDQHTPDLVRGDDIPLRETYCALVPENGGALNVADARIDARMAKRSAVTPVVSYCGIQLYGSHGELFGTLCHFDMLPCEERVGDIDMLVSLAPQLARAAIAAIRERVG
jgi:hypothetical protein